MRTLYGTLCPCFCLPGLSVRIERYQKKTKGVAQLARMQQNWFYPQSSPLSCCQDSPFTDGKVKHGKHRDLSKFDQLINHRASCTYRLTSNLWGGQDALGVGSVEASPTKQLLPPTNTCSQPRRDLAWRTLIPHLREPLHHGTPIASWNPDLLLMGCLDDPESG